jgi:3-methyladenine DNA glycosylase AlkD
LELLEIIEELRSKGSPERKQGQQRFGIRSENGFGVSMPDIRLLARKVGKNHALAQELWATQIHEAMILACLVDKAKEVDEKQIDFWTSQFYSWDLCDQVIGNLFVKTEFALAKAYEYTERREEFVKRAGFVFMAAMAVHQKKTPDFVFESFFPILIREAGDDRNFVKKANNWALRQIGKKNANLLEKAIETAEVLSEGSSPSARWIGKDALREFEKRNKPS